MPIGLANINAIAIPVTQQAAYESLTLTGALLARAEEDGATVEAVQCMINQLNELENL